MTGDDETADDESRSEVQIEGSGFREERREARKPLGALLAGSVAPPAPLATPAPPAP